MTRSLGLVVFLVSLSALASGCDEDSTLGMACSDDRDCNAGEQCDPARLVCVELGGTDAGSDGGGTDGGGTDGGGTDGGGTDGGGTDAGPATCGDRRITAPETCDDGNTTAGDGCDASCQIEVSASCGDGTLDLPAEECDDGNTTAGDGCDAMCRVEVSSACGDGTVDFSTGEQCDDGNTLPGDGCSATCQLETVGAFCGDGTMDPGELCDDSNVANGDACNPTCNLRNMVTTFIGDGTSASTDGIGTAAQITGGGTITVDNQYIWYGESSASGSSLRRIEISTGTVSTVASIPGGGIEGIATNGTDTVWAAGTNGSGPTIYSIDTTSFAVTVVAGGAAGCASTACYSDSTGGATATFCGIRGLTFWAGQLYIVDPCAGMVRRLDPSTNEVFDVAGEAFNNGYVDHPTNPFLSRFDSPRYVVSDGSGFLYVAETQGRTIRAVHAATGIVTTLVGNGTPGYADGVGTAARIHRPRGITSDGTSVYFVDFNAHAVRQAVIGTRSLTTNAGVVTTCPPGCSGGRTCQNSVCLPPGGGPPRGGAWVDGTGTAAEFFGPFSIAFHYPSNSLFVVDSVNNRIRRIQ